MGARVLGAQACGSRQHTHSHSLEASRGSQGRQLPAPPLLPRSPAPHHLLQQGLTMEPTKIPWEHQPRVAPITKQLRRAAVSQTIPRVPLNRLELLLKCSFWLSRSGAGPGILHF